MPSEIDTLKSIPLFQGLTFEELEIMAPIVHPVKTCEGEMMTRRGMAAHTIYIILTGNVMVSFKDDRAISLHKKGDIIGLSVGIIPSKYKGTAVALTDGEFLSMERQGLIDLIQENNTLGDKIMKQLNAVSIERTPIINGDS